MLQGRRSHACLLPSRVALAQDPHLPGAENPGDPLPQTPSSPSSTAHSLWLSPPLTLSESIPACFSNPNQIF